MSSHLRTLRCRQWHPPNINNTINDKIDNVLRLSILKCKGTGTMHTEQSLMKQLSEIRFTLADL